MQGKRQAIALFRYSLIRELTDPGLAPRRRGQLTRALAETDHALADGRRVKVTADTLRRWLRAWREGGYEALLPRLRRQPNRIPTPLLEAAVTLKREAPGRSAAQVARVLAEAGRGKIAERSLQRHFPRLGAHSGESGQRFRLKADS